MLTRRVATKRTRCARYAAMRRERLKRSSVRAARLALHLICADAKQCRDMSPTCDVLAMRRSARPTTDAAAAADVSNEPRASKDMVARRDTMRCRAACVLLSAADFTVKHRRRA